MTPQEPTKRVSGIIALDKPTRMSSRQAVNYVKWTVPRNARVGHAGTLDPFATGVLLVLVGSSTRLSEHLMSQSKEYLATVKLGATSITLDPTEVEIPDPSAVPVDESAVRSALAEFVGETLQQPPDFSALKIAGNPAYKLMRKGKTVELSPRPVKIYAIELLSYAWPLVKIRVECGRGTYIRSIARDLGTALGTTGYLTELRRTRVGEYRVEHAFSVPTIRERGAGVILGEAATAV